jgi:hypothetical protein
MSERPLKVESAVHQDEQDGILEGGQTMLDDNKGKCNSPICSSDIYEGQGGEILRTPSLGLPLCIIKMFDVHLAGKSAFSISVLMLLRVSTEVGLTSQYKLGSTTYDKQMERIELGQCMDSTH